MADQNDTGKSRIKYDQKSGVDSNGEYVKMLGGMPEKKKIDEIDRENMPKSYKDAVGT